MAVCVLIPGTFLSRPLQNNNVKSPNSALSREREPQRLIFQIYISNLYFKFIFQIYISNLHFKFIAVF